MLTAVEAQDWGLITEVVDDNQVGSRTAELAAMLAAGPTPAFGEAKRLERTMSCRRSWIRS